MTWKKKADMLPADLETKMAKVRKVALPPPPSDEPIYKYLKRVYRVRQALTPEELDILRNFGNTRYPKLSTNYIRLIIELTAGNHVTSKMKHKYTSALRYAFKEETKSTDLIAFIKRTGGLNKCVEAWSKKYGPSAGKQSKKKSPSRGKATTRP